MFAAVWPHLPVAQSALSPTGWRSVVIAIAPELTFVLGFFLLLFVASLIAAAVAFILDGTAPPST
jgi:hypothetical protein